MRRTNQAPKIMLVAHRRRSRRRAKADTPGRNEFMWYDHRDELADVVDVDELLARCMGNLEFAERVLGMLQERCAADIDDLDNAIAQQDVAKIASIAHRLKGAYANAAAATLKSRASELEEAARTGSLPEVEESWRSLREKWNDFNSAVSKSKSDNQVGASR
jgi:HPt (histidine-containing phosphotransfer) domain-containing protein